MAQLLPVLEEARFHLCVERLALLIAPQKEVGGALTRVIQAPELHLRNRAKARLILRVIFDNIGLVLRPEARHGRAQILDMNLLAVVGDWCHTTPLQQVGEGGRVLVQE